MTDLAAPSDTQQQQQQQQHMSSSSTKNNDTTQKKKKEEEEVDITELYDLSKQIPHVAKPDKEEFQRNIQLKLDAVADLDKKRSTISSQIDTISQQMSKDTGLSAARKVLDSHFLSLKSIQKQRNDLLAQVKAIRDSSEKLASESKAARSNMKYDSIDEIHAAIAKLELRQSTTSMSLTEEKKLLKEISSLNESKRTVTALEDKKKEMGSLSSNRKELNTSLDACKKEIDAVYELINAQKKVVEELSSSADEKKGAIPALVKERNAIRDKMNELRGEVKVMRDDFRKENNEWYNYQRAVRAQKKMRYEEEKKRREEEHAAYLKKKEEEELKKIPYEEEQDLCEYLASYMETTYLSKSDSKATDSKKSDIIAVKDDPFAGMKPMGKKENDDEVFLKMGSGKALRQRKKKQQDKVVFRLNVEIFEQFGLLSVNPPTSIEDVPASVDELKAKKQWYSEQPRGSVPTIADNRKKKSSGKSDEPKAAASNGVNKKSSKKYNMADDDFAPLGDGAGSTIGVNSTWGQKPTATVDDDVVVEEHAVITADA